MTLTEFIQQIERQSVKLLQQYDNLNLVDSDSLLPIKGVNLEYNGGDCVVLDIVLDADLGVFFNATEGWD